MTDGIISAVGKPKSYQIQRIVEYKIIVLKLARFGQNIRRPSPPLPYTDTLGIESSYLTARSPCISADAAPQPRQVELILWPSPSKLFCCLHNVLQVGLVLK